MTARSPLHPRRFLGAAAIAALAAVPALPTAAHALDTPAPVAPPPGEAATVVTAPADAPSTTTTTVAPAETPDATAGRTPTVTGATAATAATAATGTAGPTATAVRAAAVSGPPRVSASPTSGLDPAGGSTITVTGSGFDPNANNGVGVYVVFGPVDPGTYFQDANRFVAARWLHTGGTSSGSPGQDDLRADGTFSTTLPPPGGALTATYTDGTGAAVNCLVTQCYVVTMAAHGVGDRSMDTCTPVSFAGGTATANVDRACRPVSTPSGQPSGGGTPAGPSGNGDPATTATAASNGGTRSGASSTLPRTGAGAPGLALAGFVALGSGIVLVRRDRRGRAKCRPVAVSGPPDCTR
jgi:LPXTG-motif cell wall-anchored protein